MIELSRSRVSFTLDSLKEYEFKFRPTLLMQWKSCCDNKTKLAVPVKVTSKCISRATHDAFGEDVRSEYRARFLRAFQ